MLVCLLYRREPERAFNTSFYPLFARSGLRGHNERIQRSVREKEHLLEASMEGALTLLPYELQKRFSKYSDNLRTI